MKSTAVKQKERQKYLLHLRDHPQKTSPQRGREGGTKNAQKVDVH